MKYSYLIVSIASFVVFAGGSLGILGSAPQKAHAFTVYACWDCTSGTCIFRPGGGCDANPGAAISQSVDVTSSGEAFTLTWSSMQVTSCSETYTGPDGGGTLGNSLSGSVSVAPTIPGSYTATITCTGNGGDTMSIIHTVTAASCSATTINNCSLSATASGGSSGSCVSGYTGSCSYTCSNGTWNQNSNSCAAATPPAEPVFSASCAYQSASNTFSVTYSWAGVAGAVNYPVRLQGPSHATGDSPSYPIGLSGTTDVVGWGTVGDAPTASGFTFTGMTAPGAYSYWGHAWNTNGWSTNTVRTVSCNPTLPTVTTAAVTGVGQTSATSGGTVVSNGGSTVTTSGIVWGTSINPTTASSKTVDGWAIGGPWSDTMSGLTAGTTYHVRAYATNAVGTAYGSDISFTTSSSGLCSATTINNCTLSSTASGGSSGSCASGYTGSCNYTCSSGTWVLNSNSCVAAAGVPTVTTAAVTGVGQTSATSGGTVVSDGGSAVTVSGIVWGTSSSPTTALATKTTNGWAIGGPWSSSMAGLTPGTTYYVRAYATNSAGTAYGANVSFTTSPSGTSCTATTFGNCALSATGSGGSSGSCVSGYTGSCNYSCSNGVWSLVTNSCTASAASCPASYTDTSVTGVTGAGSVWGSSPYTDDSDLSYAAVHAGIIAAGQTGTIRRTTAGSLSSYAGSIQNGVTTMDWTSPWCGVTLSLVGAPPPPTLPTASLNASPTSILPGQSSTLTWGSTNATSCTFADTGVVGTSGTRVVSPAVTSTYSITCSGAGGTSAPKQKTVTVISSELIISATPARVLKGNATTVTWNATSVKQCAITRNGAAWKSGKSNGSKIYAGSSADTITARTTYVLSCDDINGNPILTTATAIVNTTSGFFEF